MTKIIILPDETLDEYYERTLQYLRGKYHSYPTSLPKAERQDARGCEAGKQNGKSDRPNGITVH